MSTRAVGPVVAAPVAVLTPLQRPMLQRTCDCGEHTGGGECEECKKKKKTPLQRHASGAAAAPIAPPIVHQVLGSSGLPLDKESGQFFEPRFGFDFSQVRVHTDARAAESAKAVDALAYTVGKKIVFGEQQYAPRTARGQELLAHELTHVMQQSDAAPRLQHELAISDPDDTAEREAECVAKAVLNQTDSARGTAVDLKPAPSSTIHPARLSRKKDKKNGLPPNKKIDDLMKQIHKKLTSFFFNLFVSEKDVHEVLQLLKPLSSSDLSEVVARMEQDGLVDRLYNHVSETDKAAEAETLQKIQNSRVQAVKTEGNRTVTVQGSCSLSDSKAIAGEAETSKEWAKKAKDAVNDFISDPAKHTATGALLDKHFFHQQNNPPGLPIAQQKSKAGLIRDNFAKVEQQANPVPNECASPVDTECTTLAAAYVPPDRSVIRYCKSFFTYKAQTQTYYVFHELTHVHAGVADRGYGDERVFAHLPADSAIDNADSYALFATDTSGAVAGGAATVRSSAPKDKIADCDQTQEKALEHDFALGSRMISRALGALGDTNPASKTLREGWLSQNFKTTDPQKLAKVRERYQTFQEKLADSINFECERSCKANTLSYYYRIFGTTVHICPPFFALPEQKQIDTLLTSAMAEELGIKSTARPGSAAYVKQSADEAIDNADSYSQYGRDVTSVWGI